MLSTYVGTLRVLMWNICCGSRINGIWIGVHKPGRKRSSYYQLYLQASQFVQEDLDSELLQPKDPAEPHRNFHATMKRFSVAPYKPTSPRHMVDRNVILPVCESLGKQA